MNRAYLILFSLYICLISPLTQASDDHSSISNAVRSEHRAAANTARDVYRHPQETLEFFGLKPDMTVLEILPGAGWYTEILAPVLQEQGKLIVASFGDDHPNDYLKGLHQKLMQKFSAESDVYGQVTAGVFQDQASKEYLPSIPDNSLDMVLTFRNTHNWIRFGGVEDVYKHFHRVLKPGGILGVVQHRAEKGADARETAENGYVPEAFIIKLAESYGFELVAKSEVNANPKDSKDHPKGVWTLPPSYRLKDVDKEKYQAIGESDRMTLRFIKLP